MRLERRHQPLLPLDRFWRRMISYASVAGGLVVFSLAIGAIGYHGFAGLSWLDALLNATMILTGMGPVDPMRTPSAKLFASAYAIFSGVAFVTIVGTVLAPVAHRFLHHFHLEMQEEPKSGPRAGR
jgi:hypothetical protein